MIEHEENDDPTEIDEQVTFPRDVDVPEEVEERLRERDAGEDEDELDS